MGPVAQANSGGIFTPGLGERTLSFEPTALLRGTTRFNV